MTRTQRHRSAGFTLGELLVVSMLMTGLTLMTAKTWRYLAVDTADLEARAQVSGELRVAMASVSMDMGPAVGAAPTGDSGLLLCQDGGATPNGLADWAAPDTVVQYEVSDGKLIRSDQTTGTQVVIARHVSSFTAEDLTATLVRMVLEVQRDDVTRKVTLYWSRP